MQYTDKELRAILDNDFVGNPNAFIPGRTNDDMVDSMCICFALGIDWNTMFDAFVQAHTVTYFGEEFLTGQLKYIDPDKYTDHIPWFYARKDADLARIDEHAERVAAWLEDKEKYGGYKRGEHDIMGYALHY